ncbi:hypothetical protein DH2020_013126 [Rehmannia glutinosa]|uniref:NUC153 domain-containing protein n=1 Tax=Rehmannia glutinosa TaxID=99300 RepID=A0ABR0X1E8_REHGL
MGSEEKKKQKKMKKNSSKKSGERGNNGGEGEFQGITDDRFKSAQSDPRFMEAPKKRSKVEIDSRFRRVFTDKSFTSSNAPVDKRGKPKNKDKAADSLKHYYRLQPKEDETGVSPIDEKEDGDFPVESDQIGHETESESEKLNEALEDDDDDDDGQSIDESSSTSTTDSDSDLDDQYMDDEEEDTLMQPEENVPEIDKETRRLAVVNLDWSQVRNLCNYRIVRLSLEDSWNGLEIVVVSLRKPGIAVDLYVLLSSFLPKGVKFCLWLSIRPSLDSSAWKRRQSVVLYYYAVVECDSSATADYLYNSCDGVEFERSANKLDLRFIPDSMDFKHQPRDVATEAPADYEGLDFQTRALQHSNIHLTWDEDEPQRAKTLKRKLNDDQVGLLPLWSVFMCNMVSFLVASWAVNIIKMAEEWIDGVVTTPIALAELELKEFLASDESETDDDDNGDGTEDRSLKKQKRDKYRALIQSAGDGSDEDNEEDNDQDMEVTFSSGLEDISKRILEKKDKKSETVWEAYLRKRKEKKKASKNGSKYSSEDSSSGDTDQEPEEQPDDFFVEEPSAKTTKKRNSVKETTEEDEASRAELELLAADDMGADANLKGYNLKPKKSKGKKGKGVPDEGKIPTVDYDDPRFSALFKSPLFALDPTDPQFKRSAAYARQITQKGKKGDPENVGQMDRSEVRDQASMHNVENVTSDGLPERKERNELSSLVKSIKMKSKQLPLPSQRKVSQKYKNLPDKAKRQK